MWFEKVKKGALLLFFFLLLVPCFVFAEELGLGALCSADTECATGLCMNAACVQCTEDAECPEDRYCAQPTEYCFPKLDNNAECDRDEMCKSGFCDKNVCASEVKTPGCCKIGVKQGDGGEVKYLTRTKFVDSEQSCYLIFSTQDAAPEIFDPKDQKEKWDFVEGLCEGGASNGASSGKAVFDLGVDASVLNQLKSTDVGTVIGSAIKAGMGVMGSIALALFVYGGVLWMASAGNAERSKKGMQVVLWAAIGMFMILASYAIVKFIFSTFS